MLPYQVIFYEDASGQCPVEEFLRQQTEKVRSKRLDPKIASLEEKHPHELPTKFYKKLKGVKDLYEIRDRYQNVFYRIVYFYSGSRVILVHAFTKRTDDTPPVEIERAQRAMDEWKGGD